MRTIKYKTLIGLLNQTRQMTVDQFINGRFHHNTKGWINFKLDEKEKKKGIAKLFQILFCNKESAKTNVS